MPFRNLHLPSILCPRLSPLPANSLSFLFSKRLISSARLSNSSKQSAVRASAASKFGCNPITSGEVWVAYLPGVAAYTQDFFPRVPGPSLFFPSPFLMSLSTGGLNFPRKSYRVSITFIPTTYNPPPEGKVKDFFFLQPFRFPLISLRRIVYRIKKIFIKLYVHRSISESPSLKLAWLNDCLRCERLAKT